jgi:hypothetical protein
MVEEVILSKPAALSKQVLEGTTVETLVLYTSLILFVAEKSSCNGSLSFSQPRECDCDFGSA